jgi:hypothetical protein
MRRYAPDVFIASDTQRQGGDDGLRDTPDRGGDQGDDGEILEWAGRLAEIDRLRVTYQRQQAEGLMTLEELRAHLDELDERRAEAESELDALRDSGRRLDELRAYSDLIEKHLEELPPSCTEGRRSSATTRTQTSTRSAREQPEKRAASLFSRSPPTCSASGRPRRWRSCASPRRERAERYHGVYTNLGLSVTAHNNGTLELPWRAGKGVSEVCASPRCTASATTS